MKNKDRFLKGDVVVIHTPDEKLYGSIGIVMDTSIFTCEVLYYSENSMVMGIKDTYESSLMKKDLEVIDHTELEPFRRVEIQEGSVMCAFEHDTSFSDLDGGFAGQSMYISNDILLRNMVTAMVIHKDKVIAKTLEGHSSVKEVADWILDGKDFYIKFIEKESI